MRWQIFAWGRFIRYINKVRGLGMSSLSVFMECVIEKKAYKQKKGG